MSFKHIFLCTMACIFGVSAAIAGPSPVGLWKMQNEGPVIAILPCGKDLCGKVHALPKGQDVFEESAIGETVLYNLKINGNRWDGIIRLDEEQTVKGRFSFLNTDTLAVSVCVAVMCENVDTLIRLDAKHYKQ